MTRRRRLQNVGYMQSPYLYPCVLSFLCLRFPVQHCMLYLSIRNKSHKDASHHLSQHDASSRNDLAFAEYSVARQNTHFCCHLFSSRSFTSGLCTAFRDCREFEALQCTFELRIRRRNGNHLVLRYSV